MPTFRPTTHAKVDAISFECPITRQLVILTSTDNVDMVEYPSDSLVVAKCSCGQFHELRFNGG